MGTPRVYIETTLFNFYFAQSRGQYYGKTVEYCKDTRRFFEVLETGDFEPYTSRYVTEEIEEHGNADQRREMLKLMADCGVTILPADERAERLAAQYVQAGAIPETQMDDALHIAMTAVHGLDFIVSLNFRHIVKGKAIRLTAMVNEAEGYDRIGIYEPGEVLGYGTA